MSDSDSDQSLNDESLVVKPKTRNRPQIIIDSDEESFKSATENVVDELYDSDIQDDEDDEESSDENESTLDQSWEPQKNKVHKREVKKRNPFDESDSETSEEEEKSDESFEPKNDEVRKQSVQEASRKIESLTVSPEKGNGTRNDNILRPAKQDAIRQVEKLDISSEEENNDKDDEFVDLVSSSDEEQEGAAAVPNDITSMKLELEKLKNLTTRKEAALKHAKQMLGKISNGNTFW